MTTSKNFPEDVIETLKDKLLWLKEMKSHLDEEVSRTDKTTEYTFVSMKSIAVKMEALNDYFEKMQDSCARECHSYFADKNADWLEQLSILKRCYRMLISTMSTLSSIYAICIFKLDVDIQFLESWKELIDYQE